MIVANQLSSSRRHLSILSNPSNEILITIKGATDVVLTRDKCSTYKTNTGEIKELTDDQRNQIIHRQEQMGSNGYRLIAMLQRTMEKRVFDQMLADKRHDDPYNGLPVDGYTFIGLFCLLDPPRVEVPEAVLKARQAKIRIAMVTGDHPTTAISIAKQVNILSPEIIQQNGFDTFHLIGIDTPTGRPIVQLLRNGAFLETHVLGTINRLEESKTHQIHLVNDENKVSVSCLKSIWAYINFYFSDPKERTGRDKKQVVLPYAIVVKGSDLTYSLYPHPCLDEDVFSLSLSLSLFSSSGWIYVELGPISSGTDLCPHVAGTEVTHRHGMSTAWGDRGRDRRWNQRRAGTETSRSRCCDAIRFGCLERSRWHGSDGQQFLVDHTSDRNRSTIEW